MSSTTKIYGIWISLKDDAATKLKVFLMKARAIQINLLTKPFLVTEYNSKPSKPIKPKMSDLFNQTVTFGDLITLADNKMLKRINKFLVNKQTIRFAQYKAEIMKAETLKKSKVKK